MNWESSSNVEILFESLTVHSNIEFCFITRTYIEVSNIILFGTLHGCRKKLSLALFSLELGIQFHIGLHMEPRKDPDFHYTQKWFRVMKRLNVNYAANNEFRIIYKSVKYINLWSLLGAGKSKSMARVSI